MEGWLKAVIGVLVFSSLAIHLVPEKYEAYLRFFLSLLIIVIVLKPVISLFLEKDLNGLAGSVWEDFDTGDSDYVFSSMEEYRNDEIQRAYRDEGGVEEETSAEAVTCCEETAG